MRNQTSYLLYEDMKHYDDLLSREWVALFELFVTQD